VKPTILASALLCLSGCSATVSQRTLEGTVIAVREPSRGVLCPTGSVALVVAPGIKEFFDFQGPSQVFPGEKVWVRVTHTVPANPFACDVYQAEIAREEDK
jgi:hypothetical protein